MTPFLLAALEFSMQSKGRFKKKPAVTQKLRKKIETFTEICERKWKGMEILRLSQQKSKGILTAFCGCS